jgi:hypothetical protein
MLNESVFCTGTCFTKCPIKYFISCGWMVFFHDVWTYELAFILTRFQNTCSNRSVLRVTAFYLWCCDCKFIITLSSFKISPKRRTV